jgi:hypothetical protein
MALLHIQHSISQVKVSLWKRLNLVEGTWNELPRSKRMVNSIVISGFIFVYLLTKGTAILLNALTLSINSFTTLGFGEIPITGIGRYLAILEGFIGWVFLTLFSVTLISQVLA